MAVSFESTYAQFVDDLKGTFPEFTAALTLASTLPDTQTRFVEVWRAHTADVASQNKCIFEGTGLELVPGFVMTHALWSEIGTATQAAIWKYISSLLLLAAASHTDTTADGLWDLSGFQHDMEAMMNTLKSSESAGGDEEGGGMAGGGMASGMAGAMNGIFEKLGKMAETFGIKDLSGAAGKFKIPERLFKGHIAKIAEELVKEFKPEDFGISPEMLETDDPARVFTYLQEVFTKKPEMLMTAAQKIAKKIQVKFQRGEIKREDIIREAEELMKEFSDNEMFSEMFGSLGEMLKGGEKESGNEGSSRRREVQERLRRKTAEKEAKRAGAGAGSAPTNTFASSEDEVRAAAAAASLLKEDDLDKAKRSRAPKRK